LRRKAGRCARPSSFLEVPAGSCTPPANVSPPDWPCCRGSGYLPNPFEPGAQAWLDCPCCRAYEARCTCPDGLPVELFEDAA